MGPSSSCWNGTTSALQLEEITSKGNRVSCVQFPLVTCPSPVLWAYASATITEFNDAHCSGDFPISSTGCTCFQNNHCGHGDVSAITLLISSLSGYNPVNIL